MNDQSDMPIDVPAIGLSFKHPLDEQGRELVFQGYIPASCSQEQINDFLDKLARAGERQKAMAQLPYLARTGRAAEG